MGPIGLFFSKYLWSILSVIADILVIAFIGYSCWLVFHPKATTTQNAQNIFNMYPEKTEFAIGKLGGFEFLSYHSYPTAKQLQPKGKK